MAATTIYNYVPHHRTKAKLEGHVPGPVKATDQLPHGNSVRRRRVLSTRRRRLFALSVVLHLSQD